MNLCFKLIVAETRNYSFSTLFLTESLETSCSMCMSEVEGEEQAKVKIYLTETAYVNF